MKSPRVVLVVLMTLIVSRICNAQHVTVVNPMGPYPIRDFNTERMEAASRMAESADAYLRREEQSRQNDINNQFKAIETDRLAQERVEIARRQEVEEQKKRVALEYLAVFEAGASIINPSDPDAEITLQILVNALKKNYIRDFIDDPKMKSTLDEALDLTFAPKKKAILQLLESQKAQQQALQGGVGKNESTNITQ